MFNRIYLKKIIKSKLELRNFDIAYYRIKRSFQSKKKEAFKVEINTTINFLLLKTKNHIFILKRLLKWHIRTFFLMMILQE